MFVSYVSGLCYGVEEAGCGVDLKHENVRWKVLIFCESTYVKIMPSFTVFEWISSFFTVFSEIFRYLDLHKVKIF